MNLVYPKERGLFALALALSILLWLLLIGGTMGAALVYILFFFLFYLFAHSALISHLRGSAVMITAQQFPDLHARLLACCQKIGMPAPDAYLMQAGGVFNAFATKFLGRNYLVLYSDIVDALESQPGGLNFYIGHELGHIHRKHLTWGPVLAPASLLPLLGAGYSRAREYTCDRYGLHCCEQPADAQAGLAVLAAGGKRWKTLDLPGYREQAAQSGGFWMSFHEVTGGYPWLVKRMATVDALSRNAAPSHPGRNPFAWFLALFVPHMPGARGGGASVLVVVAMIGIIAAIAIPAYQDFLARAQAAEGLQLLAECREKVSGFRMAHDAWPASGSEAECTPGGKFTASVEVGPGSGQEISLVATMKDDAGVTRMIAGKTIELTTRDGGQTWSCSAGTIAGKYLPAACR